MHARSLLVCTFAALAAATAAQDVEVHSTIPNVDFTARPTEQKQHSLRSDRVQLRLCDCAPATGEPGGLSCDKEGFFITSFERQGQWVAGGGSVPLSHAVCCRPCLPDALPEGAPEDDRALAVVSMGCHASTDPIGVRCEANANSFVSGFTDSVRVFTAADTQYPVNTAQCCTPALLMQSGDAWEFERCGCGSSEDVEHAVNCGGGNTTDDMLSGFDFFRISPLGQVVPIGPARCCGVCVSNKLHPAAHCSDLNNCSGNGVCLLGRCECLDGWGGPDCSQTLSGKGAFGGKIPPWAIALIVIGSCLLAMAVLSAAAHLAELIYEARTRDSDSDDGDETRRPLLLRIDADDAGSVGSQDTAECDEDVEGVEERIEGVIHRLEGVEQAEGGGGGGGAAASAARPAAAAPGQEEAEEVESDEEEDDAALDDAEAGSSVPSQPSGPLATAVGRSLSQRSAHPEVVEATSDIEQGSTDVESPTKPGNDLYQSYMGVGPLANVDCVVCMIRPVQTVVVPCGHVCMCRRCSRRLNRCPVCRKDIARRQRLYV